MVTFQRKGEGRAERVIVVLRVGREEKGHLGSWPKQLERSCCCQSREDHRGTDVLDS